ncbi:MAG: DUF1648 domain-containing protein [Bacilli bacterium]|nr:DUF1648 domain-containing protein [Bacilli bacterium]MDD4056443.1 DUF1648 domain-containing protein [Bacilli bacterium]
MKFLKKDLLILVIPVIIMFIIMPFLPDKIPMQWNLEGEVNWYLDKELSFLLGLIPFVIYELWKIRHKDK